MEIKYIPYKIELSWKLNTYHINLEFLNLKDMFSGDNQ